MPHTGRTAADAGRCKVLWAGAGGREQYYLPEQSDGRGAGEEDRKQVGRIMFVRLEAKQRLIEEWLQKRTVGVCADKEKTIG